MSVTDRWAGFFPAPARAVRLLQAQALAVGIQAAALRLAAVDTGVAAQIATHTSGLSAVPFDRNTPPPTVQALDYKTAPPPPPPPDPGEPKEPHATDPNRSADGTYGPGNFGDGKAAEKAALDELERQRHVPIIRQQVRATHPDVIDPETGKPQGRFYDGLMPTGNPDEYIGIEAKTHPGAHRADQDRFDTAVSPERPATATLNGRPIRIVHVEPAYPPDGWVPPSQLAPALPPAQASSGVPTGPIEGTITTAPPATGVSGGGGGGGGSWGGAPGPGSSTLPDYGTHVPPEELIKSDDPVMRILGQLMLSDPNYLRTHPRPTA